MEFENINTVHKRDPPQSSEHNPISESSHDGINEANKLILYTWKYLPHLIFTPFALIVRGYILGWANSIKV